DEHAKLQKASRKQRLLLLVLAGGCAVTGLGLYMGALRLTATERDAKECRKTAMRSNVALAALARSHENILAATEKAPSVGTKSWGRRFTVTMYLPRDPAYGRFNTGFTSTLWKADPKSRIVAVDPKLIPYGSWVWVEGLGRYRAQACGSARAPPRTARNSRTCSARSAAATPSASRPGRTGGRSTITFTRLSYHLASRAARRYLGGHGHRESRPHARHPVPGLPLAVR